MTVMMTTVALALALALEQAQAQESNPNPPPVAPAVPEEQVAPDAPAGAVITLDEALRIAGERNLDLRVLAAQLDQADEISWKAWSSYLPQLVASGSYTRQKEVVVPLVPAPAPPIELQKEDLLAAQGDLTP